MPNLDGSPGRSELVRCNLEPGVPCIEVILKAAWPDENLPGIVSYWLDRYEPDLVYLNVAEEWCLYEGVLASGLRVCPGSSPPRTIASMRNAPKGAPCGALTTAGFATSIPSGNR